MSPGRRTIEWFKAHPTVADGLLAVGLTTFVLIQAATADLVDQGVEFRRPGPFGVLLIVTSILPIAWRRKAPLPVFLVVAGPTILYESLGFVGVTGPWGVLIALYTVAAHCDRRRSYLAAAISAVGVAVVFTFARWAVDVAAVVSNAVVFVTAWVLGDNLQTRRAFVRSLQDRAERAERTRALEAERAVAEERTRIARELHDVVAHSMSVMVVQAGAARRILDRDPARATGALEAIEATGREAMDEMRRLLGVLRDDGAAGSLAPQPSLHQLDELADHFRRAGLPVAVEVRGQPRDLPPGLDLTAYRIVQEALTNALKHAGPASATVTVGYGDDELAVEVRDDGRGAATPAPVQGAGQGLIGMRERVEVFDGELRAGPAVGGGYQVRARLPLRSAEAVG
jgi:signal transduction histidine kinase